MHFRIATTPDFGLVIAFVVNCFGRGLAPACLVMLATLVARAEVPTGTREDADIYFRKLSATLNYSTPDGIGQTTLTDLAAYLGHNTLTAENLEFDLPETLMASGAAKGDVLVSRFFAPKIMNVKFKEGDPEFKYGWRKLVRLKSQVNSPASENHIAAAVILFNTFTAQEEEPYKPENRSVNTQVMLLPEPEFVEPLPLQLGTGTMDTVYWLDYEKTTAAGPGKLGYALEASFDANELPDGGNKPYFVPDGCV